MMPTTVMDTLRTRTILKMVKDVEFKYVGSANSMTVYRISPLIIRRNQTVLYLVNTHL